MQSRVELFLYGDIATSASTTATTVIQNTTVIGKVDVKELNIALTFQSSDIKNIGTTKASYSKTFEVPSTNGNDILFGNIFHISTVNSSYNQNKKVKCRIFEDSLQIFDGYFQILKINIKGNNIISYSCTITSGYADLVKSIGDITLRELDYTDALHTYDATSIVNSWTENDLKPYYYPLLDNGQDWDINEINGVNGKIKVQDLKPAVNVNYLLRKIFSYAGKTFSSSILNSVRWRNLVIPFTGSKLQFDSDFAKNHKTCVGLTSDFTGATNGTGSHSFTIPLDLDTGFVFYDNGNRWDTTTYEYKPDANYRIGFYLGIKLKIENYNYATFTFAQIWNSATNTLIAQQPLLVNPGTFNWLDLYLGGANATATDKYYLKINVLISNNVPAAGLPLLTVYQNYTVGAGGTAYSKLRVDIDPAIQAGNQINLKYALPNQIKATEFLKSISTLGNLYFEQNPNIEDDYIIESRNDYYNSGITVDWTSKVDNSKDVISNLVSEFYSKQILFTYKKDTDYYNDDYTTRSEGEIYSEKLIDLNNDFVTDKKKIEVIFAPTPSTLLKGSNEIVIPKLGKQNDQLIWQPADAIIRILQKARYGKITLTGSTINFEGTDYQFYPYAGMLNTPFVDESFDLSWDKPRSYYYPITGNTVTENNLYNLYWSNYIDEISSPDCRIYTFNIYLTAKDINELRFWNKVKIFYQGVYTLFYINKISDYIPSTNKSCKVELIKVLNLPPTTKSVKFKEGERLGVFNTSNGNTNVGSRNGIFGKDNSIGTFANSNIIVGSGNTIETVTTFSQINGLNNTIGGLGTRNTILGGSNNLIPAGSTGNTIIGSNQSGFDYGITGSTIIGVNNFTGTSSNTVYVQNLVISGIQYNQYWTASTGNNSLIRYPNMNVTGSGIHSFVGAGKFQNSTLANTYGFIGNGLSSTTTYNFGTVLNGKQNYNAGYFGIIANGSQNHIGGSGSEAFIGNGILNYAAWNRATIVNGLQNTVLAISSLIGNGKQNKIINGSYNTIGNGFGNIITGNTTTLYGFIGSGSANTICNGYFSFIANGINNNLFNSSYSFLNGTNNRINNASAVNRSKHNTIFGHSNYINSYYGFNSILSQSSNIKDTTIGVWGTNNAILAGAGNKIYSTSNSVVIGGINITIDQKSNVSVLSLTNFTANTNNRVYVPSLYVKDLTGGTIQYVVSNNGVLQLTAGTPFTSGSTSAITSPNFWEQSGGTKSIKLTGYSGTIAVGSDWCINTGLNSKINSGDNSLVDGGEKNEIDGNYCSIIGGYNNIILGSNSFNSIINSNVSTANGKDSYETIFGSNNVKITGDSGNACIINSKDSVINLTGSSVFFSTLIGVSAYTHNNTDGTDHSVIVPKLKHLGGVYSKNKTVDANYTVTEWDYLINLKTSSSFTITLPSSPKDGMQLFIKDYYGSCSVNNITVDGGSINIDSATTFLMDRDYSTLHLMFCSNINFWVILNYYF